MCPQPFSQINIEEDPTLSGFGSRYLSSACLGFEGMRVQVKEGGSFLEV